MNKESQSRSSLERSQYENAWRCVMPQLRGVRICHSEAAAIPKALGDCFATPRNDSPLPPVTVELPGVSVA